MKEKNIEDIILKYTLMMIGTFLLALCYNLFFLPNNLVIGGIAGLSLIFKDILNIPPQLFLYIASFSLIIVSFIFLGKEKTKNTIFGALLYPIFVSLTVNLANNLSGYLVFDDFLMTVILATLIYGVSNGIIFKTGFTTGGFDIIMQIISKYFKVPEDKALFMCNVIVILFGGLVFGLPKVIYAVIILYFGSQLINRIMIGKSNSKVFYIHTKKADEVKKYLVENMHTGVTIINTEGGFTLKKHKMLMCVVHNNQYFLVKEKVLEIDKDAFFVINDCYEVNGGVKLQNII